MLTREDWCAEESSEPLERRSGSWLGWLPWSRATGSPRANDALGAAERGERSSAGLRKSVSAARTAPSGSPRADAASALGHSETAQSSGPGKGEAGKPLHNAGAYVASSAAATSLADALSADAGDSPGHTDLVRNGQSSEGHEEPTHSAGQSKAAPNAVSSSGIGDRAASPGGPLGSETPQQTAAGLSSSDGRRGGSDAASAGTLLPEADSAGGGAQADLSRAALQRPGPSTPSHTPFSTNTGALPLLCSTVQTQELEGVTGAVGAPKHKQHVCMLE